MQLEIKLQKTAEIHYLEVKKYQGTYFLTYLEVPKYQKRYNLGFEDERTA